MRLLLYLDYTLNNPDTLTKYKTAAQISHKVLEAVTGMCSLHCSSQFDSIWSNVRYIALCLEGEKIVEICQKGDQLLDEEIAKVYKGKKIAKGKLHLHGKPIH